MIKTSTFRYKLLQENGGQLREVDPEWVRKGEEVTKEYLNSLSSKLGRQITLDELWDKEKELQKKKEEQEVCVTFFILKSTMSCCINVLLLVSRG